MGNIIVAGPNKGKVISGNNLMRSTLTVLKDNFEDYISIICVIDIPLIRL